MMKRLLFLLSVLLSGIATMWAQTETTYSPVLDVNFRTAAGNTAWNSGYPKSAADEGNTDFELTYGAGLFALQKYTVPDIQNATKLVLTLTVGSKSGVDAVRLWSIPVTAWDASTGIDDLVPVVTTTVGIAPRATEGTPSTPLVTGAKVAESNPAKATWTIQGEALATIKANAAADGTFTLLLTNNDLLNSNNKRSYLSNNTANAEANRPSLVATTTAPTPKTAKIGDTEYETLADAWAAAVAADADATIEVSGDQKLTARLTWNKAHTLSIVPTADITIKGPKNAMWFLVNTNNATLNIGAADHKITLDGISDDRSTFTNVDVTRRENTTYLNLTNIEFKDFVCGDNHLVSCKNNGGAITLENITFTNCSSTHALIDNQRVSNDALVLKGYLNVADDCSGLMINNVANLKGDGTTEGRIKVADDNFTASKVLTISWVSSDAAKDVYVANSSVVVGVTSDAIANCFALTGAPEGWTMARVNNDLKLQAPVTPTAKIADTNYPDLASALAAVQDGETITLLADQEISSRINVKDMAITIDGGGYAIKRATTYTNGLMFLTQAKTADTGKDAVLTLQNVTIDGQNVEATAAVIEASNNGTTTLNNVTIQNVGGAVQAIVNKTGGKLVLKGNIAIPSIFVGKSGNKSGLKVYASEATITSPIALTIDNGYPYVMIVEGGKTSDFTATTYRLSQQPDGIYAMPQAESFEYAHPALLHSAAEIETAKGRLTTEPYASAYAALEAASGGQAAGAVEYLKRMDKTNWEATYPDYGNFSHAATDAKLAYELALRYQLKGATAAATSAVNILNDWATNCKGILRISGKNYVNNIPDPNEYLILIQAYQFANAAELLKGYSGWTADAQGKFNTWMKETFADFAIIFLETHHGNANPLHYWLNWDFAALNALVSVGVMTNDKALVNYALSYVDNGTGTGNKANAIVATHQDPDSNETLAQCQESGRDQGHATLDVSLLGVLCQMTQNSGANTDLWTAYKALEMAEYVGKYNLKDANGSFVYTSDKVPFTTYRNGEIEHTAISAEARGTERPCWELFHAYAKKNSKADAYTEAWVKYYRAKNAGGETTSGATDELGFGTLMYGAEVTVSAITVTVKNASRVYGDANPAFEYTLSGGTEEQLGGQLEITTEAVATSKVGEYAIKAAKGTATYANLVFVDGTLTVTKAPLTISGGTYTKKQYEAMPELKAVYSGFKNEETETVLTKKPTLSTEAKADSPAGEYEVTVSGAEAENYEITYQPGKLTVTSADAITVTVKNASRVYGDANPAFEYTLSGGTEEQLGGQLEITTEAVSTSKVGEYAIKAAKGTATYANLVFVDGTLTIAKAPLTITAKNYIIKQGESLPTFEATYEGFKNNETSSVLTTQPTIRTTATSASEPGTYEIVASGAEAENYDITYVKGTLTISAVEVEPVTETGTTTFSEDVNENTDLSNTIIDNTYYTMNAENGDGYDATEQAIVLNSTTTTEQMNAVQEAKVGDATMQANYNGIIFEVPAGSGTITVEVKTIGSHVLNVQIGNGEPTKITKSERGTADVPYNVTGPTYVYLYASTSGASGAPQRAAAANSVLLYSYKVDVLVNGISVVTYGDQENAKWYDMNGRQLPGKPTKKGLYIVNGRKVIIK